MKLKCDCPFYQPVLFNDILVKFYPDKYKNPRVGSYWVCRCQRIYICKQITPLKGVNLYLKWYPVWSRRRAEKKAGFPLVYQPPLYEDPYSYSIDDDL